MAESLQDPFQGVRLSESGLRQVALQFRTNASKLKISRLICAPSLEHLELEFPSINLAAAPRQAMQYKPTGRHDKPFRMTLASSNIPDETSPKTLPLTWRILERKFGPQDYTEWQSTGLALHPPLVRESDRKHKRIFCNQAYTAAVRARTPRLAETPKTCEFKLFREDWLCGTCEDNKKLRELIMAGDCS